MNQILTSWSGEAKTSSTNNVDTTAPAMSALTGVPNRLLTFEGVREGQPAARALHRRAAGEEREDDQQEQQVLQATGQLAEDERHSAAVDGLADRVALGHRQDQRRGEDERR